MDVLVSIRKTLGVLLVLSVSQACTTPTHASVNDIRHREVVGAVGAWIKGKSDIDADESVTLALVPGIERLAYSGIALSRENGKNEAEACFEEELQGPLGRSFANSVWDAFLTPTIGEWKSQQSDNPTIIYVKLVPNGAGGNDWRVLRETGSNPDLFRESSSSVDGYVVLPEVGVELAVCEVAFGNQSVEQDTFLLLMVRAGFGWQVVHERRLLVVN